MSWNKAISFYLLGTIGQIWLICIIVLILRNLGMVVDYTTPLGMAAIGIGGISSALWGIIIAVRYKKYNIWKIRKDFFAIKQKPSSYSFVFQPVLQERYKYIASTIITFIAWGVWHFSYFYIEGTVTQVQVFEFLLGLLTNCFVLSALFIKTNSLWICVMTHALINVFSQLAIGGNQYVSYISKIVIIVMAIVISSRGQKQKRD